DTTVVSAADDLAKSYSRASQSFLFVRLRRAKHDFKRPGRWCSERVEASMDRRNLLSLSAATALGLALLSDDAIGQKAEDVDGVKAASMAFYAALAASVAALR